MRRKLAPSNQPVRPSFLLRAIALGLAVLAVPTARGRLPFGLGERRAAVESLWSKS